MKTYKPIFIIGSYRGGTSLLFRLLSESKELWSLYRESDFIWQKFFRDPREKADTVLLERVDDLYFRSLTKTGQIVNLDEERGIFDKHYNYSVYNSYFLGYLGRVRFLRERLSCVLDLINLFNYLYKSLFVKDYRLIDKTPNNSYRIEFLQALYPDAKFIYLVRNREANVKSLISAWTHKSKFKFAYRAYLTEGLKFDIQGYLGNVWKFFISPDFENYLQGKSITEVCEFQYDNVHEFIENSLTKLDSSQYLKVNFEDLLTKPDSFMQQLCDFAEIDYSSKMCKLVQKMPEVNKA